ncbi:hypothetical protein PYCCODRAFT_1372774, partial [Trametes coccinea BRFM310]
QRGKRRKLWENLWTTLCTESVHLTGKLRSERVIQNESKEHITAEVTKRWIIAIERRSSLDQMVAWQTRSKGALNLAETEAMWALVIEVEARRMHSTTRSWE